MRVLIGCEESQAVTIAMRNAGHEAYSCDIKPCTGGYPGWHIQGDVFEAIISSQWDFVGLHPPCTAMALSGNAHYGKQKARHYERLQAVEFTIKLWRLAIDKAEYVYMENPMGAMNGDRRLPKPQIVQPYYFGDEAQKTTCLWLHGLSPLMHSPDDNLFEKRTHVDKGEFFCYNGKRQPMWCYKTALLPVNERGPARSKTFAGIAQAIANQWGSYIKTKKLKPCNI